MNIYKIAKTMTRKEFLNNEELTDISGCPYYCGLPETEKLCLEHCGKRSCRSCWKDILNKSNVVFKDEVKDEVKMDNKQIQKNLVIALEDIRKVCSDRTLECHKCAFNRGGNCLLHLNDKHPCVRDFREELDYIEEKIDNFDKVNIYEVEHVQGGKRYDFISNETLVENDFVVCDTCMGKSYGVVKNIRKERNNNR